MINDDEVLDCGGGGIWLSLIRAVGTLLTSGMNGTNGICKIPVVSVPYA